MAFSDRWKKQKPHKPEGASTPTPSAAAPLDKSATPSGLPSLRDIEERLHQEEVLLGESYKKMTAERAQLLQRAQDAETQLAAMREDMQRQLKTVQGEAQAAIKMWEEKTATDRQRWSQEVSERTQRLLEESAKLAESQQAAQQKSAELGRLKDLQDKEDGQRLERMRQRLTEQQKTWRERLEHEEREITSLKARLEASETQRRLEEEKFKSAIAEQKETLENEIESRTSQWNILKESYEKMLEEKERNLSTVKLSREDERASMDRSIKKAHEERESLSVIVRERLAALETQQRVDQDRFQEMLQSLQESHRKTLAQWEMIQAQENAEHERRQKELEAALETSKTELREHVDRLSREEKMWQEALLAKSNEIQTVRGHVLNWEKDSRDQWEKHGQTLEAEKKKWEDSLAAQEVLVKSSQEEQVRALAEKDAEWNKVRSGWEARLVQARTRWEEDLSALEAQKKEIERQVKEVEAAFEQQRAQIEAQSQEKEKGLQAERAQLLKSEGEHRRLMQKLQSDQKALLAPLQTRMGELEWQLESSRKTFRKTIEEKDRQMQQYENAMRAKEEELSRRSQEQKNKIELDRRRLDENFEALKKKFDEGIAAEELALKNLEKEWSTVQEGQKKAAAHWEREREETAKSQAAQIAALQKEVVEVERKLEDDKRFSDQKLHKAEWALTQAQERLANLESTHEAQRVQAAQMWEKEAQEMDARLAVEKERLTLQWDELKAQVSAVETEKSAATQALANLQSRTQAERTSMIAHNEAALKPLEEKKRQLEAEAAGLLSVAQEKAAALTQEQTEVLRVIDRKKQEMEFLIAQETAARAEMRRAHAAALERTLGDAQNAEAREREQLKSLRDRIDHLKAEHVIQEKAWEDQKEKTKAMARQQETDLAASISYLNRQRESLKERMAEEEAASQSSIASLQNKIKDLDKAFADQTHKFEQHKILLKDRFSERQGRVGKLTEQRIRKLLAERQTLEQQLQELKDNFQHKKARWEEDDAHMSQKWTLESDQLKARQTELESALAHLEENRRSQMVARQKTVDDLSKKLAESQRLAEFRAREHEKNSREERTRLAETLRALTQKSRHTEEETRAVIDARHEEIAQLQHRAQESQNTSEAKRQEKTNQWMPVLAKLRDRVDQLTQALQDGQVKFTEELEKHESAVQTLEEEHRLWEKQDTDKRTARDRSEDEEKAHLKGEIDVLTDKLAALEQESALQLTAKDREIEQLKADIQKFENEQGAALKDDESAWTQGADKLQVEIKTLEDRARQEEAQHTEKIQDLARRISQFESEKAMKDTTLQAEDLRRQREFEKARRPFEQRQRELERRIAEVDHSMQSGLRSKDSQIRTLLTRLELRRERIRSDRDRKDQELTRLKSDLLQKLEATKTRWQEISEKRAREMESHIQKLAALEAVLKHVNEQTAGLKAAARQQIEEERHAMEMRLADFEKSLAAKKADWDTLMASKDKEMANFMAELAAADLAIHQDNEKRKVWLAWCQALSRDLQNLLKSEFPDDKKWDGSASDILRQGIEAYEAGRHPEALSFLTQCVEREPRWETAWQFRALALEALGLKAEAIRAAKTALQINPESRAMRDWLSRIEPTADGKRRDDLSRRI